MLPLNKYKNTDGIKMISDANEYMGSKIKELAERRPDLCDKSGRGFWPVPASFPSLLSHAQNQLQSKIQEFYLKGEVEKADTLASVRMDLQKLVHEGDLGENHTRLFLNDHSGIQFLSEGVHRKLPFYNFCETVLDIEDPIMLMGIISRNEEGSLGEAHALAATGLVNYGPFATTHLREEVEHGRLSERIRKTLSSHSDFHENFVTGIRVHDQIYHSILGELAPYQPFMSESEQKRLRVWDENVYYTLKKIDLSQEVERVGRKLRTIPGVHAGSWTDTGLLGKAIEDTVTAEESVLDLGTGTGIQGIIAAKKAKFVTSIDFNPKALECARENIKAHGLAGKIELLYSDGFSNLSGRVYDTIAINIPFRWFKPKDILDAASNDENYVFLNRFFKEAKDHLSEKGKILFVFANTTDTNYMLHLSRAYGYAKKVIKEERPDDWRVYKVYEFKKDK